jgi:hypothetical protein
MRWTSGSNVRSIETATVSYIKCNSSLVGASTCMQANRRRSRACQHTSAYVSILQHTSAYVSIRIYSAPASCVTLLLTKLNLYASMLLTKPPCLYASNYTSTPLCVTKAASVSVLFLPAKQQVKRNSKPRLRDP